MFQSGRHIALILCLILGLTTSGLAQSDSVILNVGKSKIIFIVNDKSDLATMQKYDLNEVLDQLTLRLTGDSTLVRKNGSVLKDTVVKRQRVVEREPVRIEKTHRRKPFETRHKFNFDVGVNNYVNENGDFPDETDELYAVKTFGSWYVGINSIYKTHLAGPAYLEWGGGVSWYNFKFQNTKTRLTDTPDGVVFTESTATDVEFDKSKLTVFYAQVSAVSLFEFGSNRRAGPPWTNWLDFDNDSRGFRIGAGGYLGYRLDSYVKTVIENGDRDKSRNHDNFHLENIRYGVRFQMGFRGTDLFFNYDLNELFSEGNGPPLNAFSFGLIF